MAHMARVDERRRRWLGAGAALLASAMAIPSFGVEPGSAASALSPGPLPSGAMEASASASATGVVSALARARKGGFGAGLWIRNEGASPLTSVHAVARAYAGGSEAYFVRFSWEGSLPPGAWVHAGALGFGFEALGGAPAPAATELRIEVVYAAAGAKSVGKPASWAPTREQARALRSEMDAGLDADERKSAAYAKGKGEAPSPVAGFAKMWAPQGSNPYDPAEMRVAVSWRARAAQADIKGLWARFYQSPSLSPFMRVELDGSWRAQPGEAGMAFASFGVPGASAEFRRSFEARARSHGVDIGRSYVDPSKAERPAGQSK